MFALSFTTTCNIYVPSPLPVTVGFCVVLELNEIVPVPESFVHVYHEIHEISPVTVMLVDLPVFVVMSDHILSNGAVVSIL